MRNNFPKVSVIIPTYNRQKFITMAIDSVLSQTFKDYEIIVIDDGSTDNTRQVLESYEEKIKYIYQKNSGVSAARNAGIRLARGELVAFLDSDDEWLPDYLSITVSKLNNNSKLIALYSDSYKIDFYKNVKTAFEEKKINKFFDFKNFIIKNRPLILILKHNLCNLQSFLVKREALIKAGPFDTKLTIGEDIDMICRIALQGAFGIFKKPLVNIYNRGENIPSLTQQYFFNKGIYTIIGYIYNKIIKNSNISLNEKLFLRKIISSNCRAIANLLLRCGKKIEASAL